MHQPAARHGHRGVAAITAPPTTPTAPTHQGGAATCHKAQDTCDNGTNTAHSACKLRLHRCHKGEQMLPNKAKGVTTSVTQGMANKFTSKPTMEIC